MAVAGGRSGWTVLGTAAGVARGEHVPDVRTLTDRERRDEDIARRRKLYLMVMVPYLGLVAAGFFLLPNRTARIVVLLGALAMPPVAAILANAGRRG